MATPQDVAHALVRVLVDRSPMEAQSTGEQQATSSLADLGLSSCTDVGIDMERVDRFNLPSTDAFITRTFTKGEIAYAYAHTTPQMHLAGCFCVKEAYVKAVHDHAVWSSLDVRHDARGSPVLYISGAPAQARVSVAHTTSDAIAVVVLLEKDSSRTTASQKGRKADAARREGATPGTRKKMVGQER